MPLFLDAELRRARRWPRSGSRSIDFARYCLPQVFFYGMFVLVGQILNARGRFGPMMWAPIANNVISVARARDLPGRLRPGHRAPSWSARSPRGQELLLGLGSTLGIVAQFADPGALPAAPPASASGPASTSAAPASATPCGSGVWTVLFVIVNQIAYTVVVRLASGGTAAAAARRRRHRLHDLLLAFLIVMVPHSVITVSLATAILPRLSRARRRRRPGRPGPHARRRRCAAPWPSSSRSRCCCR